jgi:hypothetical protein
MIRALPLLANFGRRARPVAKGRVVGGELRSAPPKTSLGGPLQRLSLAERHTQKWPTICQIL